MAIWISVNKYTILSNAKHGRNEPPIRVARGKHGKPIYGHHVGFNGYSEIIYSPDKPLLPCGARLAIRTNDVVYVQRDGDITRRVLP